MQIMSGNLTISGTSNLGAVGNITITGGSNGQYLQTNGSGVLTWSNAAGGLTLTANNTDTSTYYLPMTTSTSGTWSSGVIANSQMYFVPSTGTLSATVFTTLSDENYKTNVQPITNAVSTLNQIEGVEFEWKQTGKQSYGVIAQNLETILPNLVTDTDPKTVNYNGLIAFLINAIKELDERVKILEG